MRRGEAVPAEFMTHSSALRPATGNGGGPAPRNGAVHRGPKPDPQVWAAAVKACGGDLGRLVIEHDGKVTISNQSIGKTPRLAPPPDETLHRRARAARHALFTIHERTKPPGDGNSPGSEQEHLDAMLARLRQIHRIAGEALVSEALMADGGEARA